MRLRSFYYALGTCLLLALTPPAAAQQATAEYLQQIEREAREFLLAVLAEQAPADRLEVAINSPDPRLRLNRCDNALTYSLHGNANNASNVTVRVQCEADRNWSFYLTASVERLRQVAVALRNIPRGTQLTSADLQTEQRRLSGSESRTYTTAESALGMVTRRPISLGDVIPSSSLTEPTAVRKGDQVQVRAVGTDLNIVTLGIAMSSGKVGDQIRIKNSSSERIIRARISAPGEVEVYL